MNLREYFESLTHAERVRVKFYPPDDEKDYAPIELQALQSMERQWQALLNGFEPHAMHSAPEDQDAALKKFLGQD